MVPAKRRRHSRLGGMTPYERLEAWKLCHELVLAVYRATESFPKHERYGLTSQTRRAAISAPANIAEGSARRGAKEFRRFIDIARGSLSELEYLLRLARDLAMLSQQAYEKLGELCNRAGFVTWRLYQSISSAARTGKHRRP